MLDNTLERLDAQLGTDERFLIAAIAVFFIQGRAIPAVKELASCLHISQKYVARGLKKLVSREFLSVNLIPATDRGRPSHLFKLTPQFSRWLHETVRPEAWAGQEAALKAVLSGDFLGAEEDTAFSCQERKVGFARPPVRTKSPVLLVRSRLIMAVLISKSDEQGRVCGVTASELAKMSGVPSSNIRNQIQSLLQRKKVFDYVPGLSSRWFRKAKMTTTYYLNLRMFPECKSGRLTLVRGEDSDIFEEAFRSSARDETRKILSMMRQGEIAILMAEMLKETSDFLSECWDSLETATSCYEKDGVSACLRERVDMILNVPVDLSKKAQAKEQIGEDATFFIVQAAWLVKCMMLELDLKLTTGSPQKIQIRPVRRSGTQFLVQMDLIIPGYAGQVLLL